MVLTNRFSAQIPKHGAGPIAGTTVRVAGCADELAVIKSRLI
jgi:hypothetical protein